MQIPKPLQKIVLYSIATLGFVLGSFLFSAPVPARAAWTEPGETPPGGNVAAPLNVSSIPQTKFGSLSAQAPDSSLFSIKGLSPTYTGTDSKTVAGIWSEGSKATRGANDEYINASAAVYGVGYTGTDGTGQQIGLFGVAGNDSSNSYGIYGWDNKYLNAYAGFFRGHVGVEGDVDIATNPDGNGSGKLSAVSLCLEGVCKSSWGDVIGPSYFTYDAGQKLLRPDTDYTDASFALGGTNSADAAFYFSVAQNRGAFSAADSVVIGPAPAGGVIGDKMCSQSETCSSPDCYGMRQGCPGDLVCDPQGTGTCVDKTPPVAPNNLRQNGDATNTSIPLAWDPVVDSDLAGYNVYQCNAADCGSYAQKFPVRLSDLSNQNAPTYTDNGSFSTKKTYYYEVKAYDNGSNESFPSNILGVQPQEFFTNNPRNPTVTFSALPTTIQAGESATLTWTSQNAVTVSIDNGVGNVTPIAGGSAQVSPTQTATYTLTATGAQGTTPAAATATVTVLTPTVTLSADPTSIVSGNTTTLSWTSANADALSIDHGIGNVAVPSGTTPVTPAATTTYTITASKGTAQATASATVTVVPDDAPTVPTGLGASAWGDTSITLRWTKSTDTDGTGVAGYELYRCAGLNCTISDDPSFRVATVNGDPVSPTYQNTGLKPCAVYGYEVKAFDSASPQHHYSALSAPYGIQTTGKNCGGGPTPFSLQQPANGSIAVRTQPETKQVFGIRPLAHTTAFRSRLSFHPFVIDGAQAATDGEVHAQSIDPATVRLTVYQGIINIVGPSGVTAHIGQEATDATSGRTGTLVTSTNDIFLRPLNSDTQTEIARFSNTTGKVDLTLNGGVSAGQLCLPAGQNGGCISNWVQGIGGVVTEVVGNDPINAVTNGSTVAIGLNTPLALGFGGTGAKDADTARTNLLAAKSGKNIDITELANLTTPLSPRFGGTGTSTVFTSGSVVFIGSGGGLYVEDNGNLHYDSANHRLGIGMSGPSTTLDVNGQITIRGGSPGDKKVLVSDANGLGTWSTVGSIGGVTGTGTANTLPKWGATSGTLVDSLVVDDNSGVGVGTAPSASYKLTVAGKINASTDFCINGDCVDSWSDLIRNQTGSQGAANFNIDGSGRVGTTLTVDTTLELPAENRTTLPNFIDRGGTFNSQAYTSRYVFGSNSDTTPEYFGIASSNNASNPIFSLADDRTVHLGTSGSPSTLCFYGDGTQCVSKLSDFPGNISGSTNHIAKFTSANALGTSGIFEDADSEVGIGTTEPSRKFHVKSGSSYQTAFLESQTNVGAGLTIDGGSGFSGRQYTLLSTGSGAGAGAGKFTLLDESAGATRLTVDANGNVGIGTTSPSGRLQVLGDTFVDGDGGTSAGTGKQTSIAEGATLVSALNQKLCTDSLTAPTIVRYDTDGCSRGNGTVILGTGTGGTIAVDAAWVFNDADSDCNGDGTVGDCTGATGNTTYDLGQDLYIDRSPSLAYSTGSVLAGPATTDINYKLITKEGGIKAETSISGQPAGYFSNADRTGQGLLVQGRSAISALTETRGLTDVAAGASTAESDGTFYGKGPTYHGKGDYWRGGTEGGPAKKLIINLGAKIEQIMAVSFGTFYRESDPDIPKIYDIAYGDDDSCGNAFVSVTGNKQPSVIHYSSAPNGFSAQYVCITVNDWSVRTIAGVQVLTQAYSALYGYHPFSIAAGGDNVILATGGNVGIGDTSPASLLTVGDGDKFQVDGSGNVSTAGTLAVTGATTLSNVLNLGQLTADPTTNLVKGQTYYNTQDNKFRCYENNAWTNCIGNGGVNYWTSNGQNNIYNSNTGGNVGIGQTAPGAKLTVNNPTDESKVGSANDAVYAYANSKTGAAISGEQANAEGYAGYFSGNIKLGADNSGNYVYHVKDSVGTIIRTTRSDVTQEGLFRTNGWGDFTFSRSLGVGYDLSGGSYGAGNLLVSGNVGIGTTTPQFQLHNTGANEVGTTLNTAYGGIGRYQNYVDYSEQLNQWSKNGTITYSVDSTAAPNGESTADTITGTTDGAQVYRNTSVTDNATYTFSVWLRTVNGTNNTASIGIADCGYDGGQSSDVTVNLTTTWQRFTVSRTFDPQGNACPEMRPGGISGTGTIVAWGAQLEKSAVAGTYAKTSGTAIPTASSGVIANAATGNSLFYGNVGIGDTSPAALFTVGDGDTFQVDGSGNLVKINDVTYSWPSAIGTTDQVLKITDATTGALGWSTQSGGITSVVAGNGISVSTNNSTATVATLLNTNGGLSNTLGTNNELGIKLVTNHGLTLGSSGLGIDFAANDTWSGTHAFTNTAGIALGEDKTDTSNTAGQIKLVSAGDNAFLTTLKAATQTGNLTLTFPTSVPSGTAFVKSDTNGNLSWDTSAYLTSFTEADTLASVTGRGYTTGTKVGFGQTGTPTLNAQVVVDQTGNSNTGSAGDALASYASSSGSALYAQQTGTGYAGYFSGDVAVGASWTELAKDGDFWTNTNNAPWTYGQGWTNTNHQADHAANNDFALSQQFSTTDGVDYVITFDALNVTQNQWVQPAIGNQAGTKEYTNGTFTQTITASTTKSNNILKFLSSSSFVGAVDNVSVKRQTTRTGEVRLSELGTNGTEYVGFKAPDAVDTSQIYMLPNTAPSSNAFLKSSTTGTLSWDNNTYLTSETGDISGIGDCTSGECFTGSSGANLTFKGTDTGTTKLDTKNTSATSYIASLPAATGEVVLDIAAQTLSNKVNTVSLNAGAGGVSQKQLVKLDTTGKVIPTATTDTNGAVGVAQDAATEGNATRVAVQGKVTVTADGSGINQAGNYVGISTTVAGRAKDLGATYPTTTGVQVLGRAAAAANTDADFTLILTGLDNSVSASSGTSQWTTNNNDIYNNNSGNVGIGTTSPLSKLHVQGAASQTGTGYVTNAVNSTVVTGDVNTIFQTQLHVGDTIKIGSETHVITTIGGVHALTVDSNFTSANTNASFNYQPAVSEFATSDGTIWSAVNALGNVGIGQNSSGAKFTVNNPTTLLKTGSSADAIYAYANSSSGAAISGEQGNASGYAGYFSGNLAVNIGNVIPAEYVGKYENLAAQSEGINLAPWRSIGTVSFTADVEKGPDNGAQTADEMTINVGAGNGRVQDISLSASVNYTVSVWARSTSGTNEFRFVANNGTTSSYSPNFTTSSSWQRFTWTFSFLSVSTPYVGILNTSNLAATTIRVWGFQLEQAGTAGQYVRTTSTATVSTQGVLSNGTPVGAGGSGTVTNVTASAPLASSQGPTPNINFGSSGVGTVLVGSADQPTFSSTPTVTTLTATGLTLSTDNDGTVGGASIGTTLTKSDGNTRKFAVASIKPTINTGGSNSNTTLNVLSIDTVNTATTGVTTNLINAAYGGTGKFTVDSNGNTTIGGTTSVMGDITSNTQIRVLENGSSQSLYGIFDVADLSTGNKTYTFPDATGNVVLDSATQTLTNKTYNGLSLTSATDGFGIAGGTTSRTLTLTGGSATFTAQSAGSSIILPATGTLVTTDATQTLTNKTIGSSGLTFSNAETDISTSSNEDLKIDTGSGNVYLLGSNYKSGGCDQLVNNGKLTTDSSGKIICAADVSSVGGGSTAWSSLTAPTANLALNLGTNTSSFNYSGTTTGWTYSADSVTTQPAEQITANGLTTGSVLQLKSTSTTGAASGNSKVLEITRSGSNSAISHTAYGVYSSVTDTGTSSTNVAGYFSASGATNNYGLLVPNGNVLLGNPTDDPSYKIVTKSGGIKAETSTDNQPAGYFNSNAGITPYALVTDKGNVGIGTTTPQGRLDVNTGSTPTDALYVKSSPSTAGQGGIIQHQGDTYAWEQTVGNTSSLTGGGLSFSYAGRTSPYTKEMSDVLTLRSNFGNGSVGIGSADHHATLTIRTSQVSQPPPALSIYGGGNDVFAVDINGNVSAAGTLTAGSNVTVGGLLSLSNSGITGAGLASCNASGSKLLWDASTNKFSCGTDLTGSSQWTTNGTNIYNNNTGNVGIGTNTTVNHKLSVNSGNSSAIIAYGGTTQPGTFSTYGTAIGAFDDGNGTNKFASLLVGQSTANFGGLRWNYNATVANATLDIGTFSAQKLNLITNGLSRLSVDKDGNVSIPGLTASSVVLTDGSKNLTSTSTLGIGNGGTGATTLTSNGVLYGNGTNAVSATAAGKSGECLVGTTDSAPSWGSCASGGAGDITAVGNCAGGECFTGAVGSNGSQLIFKGANNTTLGFIDPTTSRTITLPNADGSVVLDTATQTLTNKSYNGLSLTAATDGFAIAGGTTSRSLTVTGSNITLTGGGKTLNLGGNLTTAGNFTTVGAYALTLRTTAATDITLPTTGTLVTTDATQTLTNKTIGSTLTFSNVSTDITTGANEDFVISPNGTGKVGIGTATPDANYKLEVTGGGVKATSSVAANPGGYFSNDASGTPYGLLVDKGNVGIGTTIPSDRLQLTAANTPVGLGEIGRANLVFNGAAEHQASGWTSTTFGINGGSGDIGTVGGTNDDTPLSGSFDFRAFNGGGMKQTVTLVPGGVYTLSAHMRVRMTNDDDASQGRLVVQTVGGTHDIVDQACNPNTYDVIGTLNQWVLCSATFSAPTAANQKSVNVEVGFRSEGATHSVSVDDVALAKGGLPADYQPVAYTPANGAVSLDAKVGIGTQAPNGLFQLGNGSPGNNWAYFDNNTNTTPANLYGLAIGWNKSQGEGETNLVYNTSGGTAPRLAIGSFNGTTYREELSVNNGTLTVRPQFDANNYEGGEIQLLGGTAGPYGKITLDSWKGIFRVFPSGGGSEAIDVIPNGSVGIGVTSPLSQLQVNGGITLSSPITMTASKDATTFTTSSAITINTNDYVVPTNTTAQARVVTVGGTGTNSFTVSPAFSADVSAQTFTIHRPITNLTTNTGTSSLFAQGYTGNVGIGNNSPGSLLTVGTSAYAASDSITAFNASTAAGYNAVTGKKSGNGAVGSGVYGEFSGTCASNSTCAAIYGSAGTADNTYAGYFSGKVKITGNLTVNGAVESPNTGYYPARVAWYGFDPDHNYQVANGFNGQSDFCQVYILLPQASQYLGREFTVCKTKDEGSPHRGTEMFLSAYPGDEFVSSYNTKNGTGYVTLAVYQDGVNAENTDKPMICFRLTAIQLSSGGSTYWAVDGAQDVVSLYKDKEPHTTGCY